MLEEVELEALGLLGLLLGVELGLLTIGLPIYDNESRWYVCQDANEITKPTEGRCVV